MTKWPEKRRKWKQVGAEKSSHIIHERNDFAPDRQYNALERGSRRSFRSARDAGVKKTGPVENFADREPSIPTEMQKDRRTNRQPRKLQGVVWRPKARHHDDRPSGPVNITK